MRVRREMDYEENFCESDPLLEVGYFDRAAFDGAGPVSYTHLDVYKRQALEAG